MARATKIATKIATKAATVDSTVAQVLEHLRQDIITGRYAPGSKLAPKAIADGYGVSFIPVREALRVLESEGFVEFLHNRGAWVTPMSSTDLVDLYDIRIELETQAVRHARPLSTDTLDRLDALLGEATAADRRGDNARIIEINRDFHMTIYDAAGSPRRMRLIEQLWLHSARYQRVSLEYRHDAADAEHRSVLDHLRSGALDQAAGALGDHLRTTVSLLLSGLQQV
jgi:DNA-binding GntR family transcriptional regulator